MVELSLINDKKYVDFKDMDVLLNICLFFLPFSHALPVNNPMDRPNSSDALILRISDIFIGISYLLIPIQILFYGSQFPTTTKSQKLILLLFAWFVCFCGIGHLADTSAPMWLITSIRVLTAIVSLMTAGVIYFVLPAMVLAIRDNEELQRKSMINLELRKTVFENTPHFVMVVQTNGEVTLANRLAQRRLWGIFDDGVYDMGNIMWKFDLSNFEGTVPDAKTFFQKFDNTQEKNWTLLDKDGTPIPVIITITPLLQNDTLSGYLVMAVDVSMLHGMLSLLEGTERKLGRDRTNLFRIVKMVPVGIAAFDSSMRCIDASPRWKEDLEISNEIHDMSYFDMVEIPEEWRAMVHKCLESGELDLCERRYGMITNKITGKIINVHWSVSPWYVDKSDGREIGVCIVVESVQQLVLDREAALLASEQKSIFLANMSHELRTPLNGIIGFTDVLIKELSGASDAGSETTMKNEDYELLKSIKVSGESLLTLVNDILDFSKIEAGKMDIDPRVFSLRQCLANMSNLFEYSIKKGNLEFHVDIENAVPDAIYADDSRL